jgi:PadR family transcriptional regulator, regulatory protein PadR
MSADRFDGPAGLPRNYLRPCLLLLLAEGSAHGYDLLEQLPALGHTRADPGGMYRSLRAMEQEGLVTSTWEESPAGPARRTYDLTEEGTDWLHAWAGSLRLVHASLGTFLQRYVTAEEGSAADGHPPAGEASPQPASSDRGHP